RNPENSDHHRPRLPPIAPGERNIPVNQGEDPAPQCVECIEPGRIPARGEAMRSNAIVRAACCMVVVAASLGAPSIAKAPAPPTAAQTTQFDIKPQALASALNALALQSHQQILFTPEVAKGKTTQGVKGALTADKIGRASCRE